MLEWVVRLLDEDSGQDLVEYALLTAFIAFAGIGLFGLMMASLNTGYTNWDSRTQGIWEMPPPQ